MKDYLTLREIETIMRILFDIPIGRRRGGQYRVGNKQITQIIADKLYVFCVVTGYRPGQYDKTLIWSDIGYVDKDDCYRIAKLIMKEGE